MSTDTRPPTTALGITADSTLSDLWAYHQRSKHRPDAYAAGPGSLDWDQQPDPFRRYDGCQTLLLPLAAAQEVCPWSAVWLPLRLEPRRAGIQTLGLLLEQSLALSAWKQYGSSRWSLRCNPSSGNLHPTETTLLIAGIEGMEDGVYHYRPDLHALELRARPVATPAVQGIWIGFSSLIWREAWKYGERAWRYCQHDNGHALAAVSFAARTLGWTVCPLTVADVDLAAVLGLEQICAPAEPEYPETLLALNTGMASPVDAATVIAAWLAVLPPHVWMGQANVVDPRHWYQWPVLAQAQQLAQRPAPVMDTTSVPEQTPWPQPRVPDTDLRATQVIRQRRSAQAFDGKSIMAAEDFFTLLDHSLPRPQQAPWQALGQADRVHLMLFVHRVEGLVPGLYVLPRTAAAAAQLRTLLRPEFQWQPVATAPAHLPLFLLLPARAERTASRLSCQQAIAGDSCFSLAMLADLQPMQEAPWFYRECLQEAGAIGQQLYLDAEACGLRGTGIGCFYDDAVHELLGLQSCWWQSLYHFTVGVALHDSRVIGLPPYGRR